MHSAEPIDPRSLTPAEQPPANEAWRAEVASRVHNYRARKGKGDAHASLALDFEPRGGQPEANASASATAWDGAIGAAVQHAEPHNAFDTNYYRRLNARAIEQSAAVAAATAAAEIATVAAVEVTEGEWAAASDLLGDEIDLTAEYEAVVTPEFDMELHAPAPGDACLDRYCIQPEPSRDWEEAVASAVQENAAEELSHSMKETLSGPPSAEIAEAQAEPAPAPEASVPVQSNLIVFPRPLLEPPLQPLPSRDELAEPVHAKPRILEVPEDIMPAVQGSLFPEIRLDADEPEERASREPAIEVPLRVAPVSVRVTAALTDAIVVLAAGALFAGIAGRVLADVPHAKPFWMGMGAVTVVFWAVYQNLFLLYAGRTLGMSMNHIQLSTFDGREPGWEERKRRAIFTVISFVSVALGFLWALVDEDTLCWHDRVSQTFPTTD